MQIIRHGKIAGSKIVQKRSRDQRPLKELSALQEKQEHLLGILTTLLRRPSGRVVKTLD